jgi:cytochrome b
MPVAAQQDLDPRPVRADRPDQPAQMRGDLAALRPLRRAQHRGHEPAGAVEDHDRLEAVLVVVGVEQPQLLTACTASKVSSMSSVIRFGTCAKEVQ